MKKERVCDLLVKYADPAPVIYVKAVLVKPYINLSLASNMVIKEAN